MYNAPHPMKRLLTVLATFSLILPGAVYAATLDQNTSKVAAEKTALNADGIDNARVVVALKDTNLGSIVGATVTLTSSRGSIDEIRIEHSTTDMFGKAYFRVFSLKDGTSVFSATANGIPLTSTATIAWSGGLSFPLVTGDLIKLADVWGLFPNDKCFFTWYPDFSKVQIIPGDQMSLIPIGGNVTYHPGVKMVKFQTDVKTYAVSRGGTLRWVKTEEAARGMYGLEWNTKVDDINEAFYVNYTFGWPIEYGFDYAPDVVRNSVNSIDYDKGLE